MSFWKMWLWLPKGLTIRQEKKYREQIIYFKQIQTHIFGCILLQQKASSRKKNVLFLIHPESLILKKLFNLVFYLTHLGFTLFENSIKSKNLFRWI